jgi:hypothetical protein
MSQHSTCIRLICSAGLVGLLAAVPSARPASAQNLNDMVRTLNNVINPGDAQRLEDQARRNGRPQEERYWRDDLLSYPANIRATTGINAHNVPGSRPLLRTPARGC